MSTAGEIMDTAAGLLNDPAREQYSYAVQLPYLKMALKELRETFEVYQISVTSETSAVILVTAGIRTIGFNTVPALPSGLVDIQKIWQSEVNQDAWTPIDKKRYVPPDSPQISWFDIWAWMNNEIRFRPSIRNIDIKIDYIKSLFTTVVDQNSQLNVVNADSFLHYRTAGLVAEFIAEDISRADKCNANAGLALDRVTGIDAHSEQHMPARRRPMRS